MSVLTPINNLNIFEQTYTKAIYGDMGYTNSVILAPATFDVNDWTGYRTGCILAKYTSGTNIGKYVNYDINGTNGQDVPVSPFIFDDNIPFLPDIGQNIFVSVAMGGRSWIVRDAILYATAADRSDVAGAMAQLGARSDTLNGELVWIFK